MKVATVEGKSELSEYKAGNVSWGRPAKHTEENLSPESVEELIVQLKG